MAYGGTLADCLIQSQFLPVIMGASPPPGEPDEGLLLPISPSNETGLMGLGDR